MPRSIWGDVPAKSTWRSEPLMVTVMIAFDRSARLAMRYSSMSSINFAPPTSLLPTWAIRSPSTNSGVRMFCLMSLKRSRLGLPPSNSLSIGTYSPSSKTSRASAPRVRPPMSMAWQVFANSATNSPAWKMGVTTVKSLRWPEVSQGAFVLLSFIPSKRLQVNHPGGISLCFTAIPPGGPAPGLSEWAAMPNRFP
jgi:hypothetical protein